jgi:hypothetical protein
MQASALSLDLGEAAHLYSPTSKKEIPMTYQDKPGASKEEKPSRTWWSGWWPRPDKKAEAQRLDKGTELPVREDNEDREDDRAKQRAGKQ